MLTKNLNTNVLLLLALFLSITFCSCHVWYDKDFRQDGIQPMSIETVNNLCVKPINRKNTRLELITCDDLKVDYQWVYRRGPNYKGWIIKGTRYFTNSKNWAFDNGANRLRSGNVVYAWEVHESKNQIWDFVKIKDYFFQIRLYHYPEWCLERNGEREHAQFYIQRCDKSKRRQAFMIRRAAWSREPDQEKPKW